MTRRVMLLGAAGQIGQTLQSLPLPAEWEPGLYGRRDLDITDAAALRGAVQSFRPDLVINAAAMTNVDQAEQDRDGAMDANFHAPAHLAAQCSAHDIPLIHLSTDYVFDGGSDTPYRPDDAMNPVNAYGQSKMMGEEAIRHELAWHVILRVSWVFGAFGRNLLTNALKLIDERDELRFVTDQFGGPTPAPDVARAILVIAQALLDGKADGFGTFHFCGAPACTRFEFMRSIMEAYAPCTSRRPNITPAVSADFAHLARRPAYSVLDCAKTHAAYGLEQPAWRDGLDEAMWQLMRNRSAE
jgi:dTDP-4-dehydrorhamnose reductase